MKNNLPYSVLREYNSWQNVPRAAAVGAAIMGNVGTASLFGSTFLGGALAFITPQYIVGFLVTSLVTSWAMKALAPKSSLRSSSSSGLLVNAREPAASQDFVYGEVRKGGVITFYESSGDNNTYLHQIIALAGHEVHSVDDIYINDQVATFSGNFVTTTGSGDSQVNWDSKIRIKKYDGSQTTADSDLVSETSATSTFVGKGIAYLYVRYEYDQDVFANGLPLITAKIRGKKVYDPRTASTAYSNNAALCIRDFLTSSYGLSDNSIDDVDLAAAANECDENVALDGGGTEKRYTANGVIKASTPTGSVLEDLVTSCAGTLFWGGGKWKLKAGAYTSPVKTLTLDDLRGPINLSTRVSMRDNFNTVRGTFNDAAQDYITADYPEIKSTAFINQDDGEEVALDLELPFTTSSASAQRLAKLTLFRGREQMTLSADFGLEAMEVEVGDIIAFTNARYGFSAKEFEVVGWKLSASEDAGDLRINLTLRETSQAAFDWNAEETAIISNDSDLPAFTSVAAPTNLTLTSSAILNEDGATVPSIEVEWDESPNAFVQYYEIQYKRLGTGGDPEFTSVFGSSNYFVISPTIVGENYQVKVRAVSALGVRSIFASATLNSQGDTTAPNAPTSLAATGASKFIEITWVNPADRDLRHVEVWENSSNNLGTATFIGSSSSSGFIRGNLTNGIQRYYWVRAVDFSDNKSAFVGSVNATTLFVQPADFSSAVDDLFTEAERFNVKPVQSLPTSGDADGQLVLLLPDITIYRWDATASAWETEVFTDTANSSITSSKIATNAVVADKIAAGSIITSKLATGAVTANEIAANTISANEIASNYVYAGTLTAAQVNAVNINADEMSTGTITSTTSNPTGSQSGFKVDTQGRFVAGDTDAFIKFNGSGITFKGAVALSSPGILPVVFEDLSRDDILDSGVDTMDRNLVNEIEFYQGSGVISTNFTILSGDTIIWRATGGSRTTQIWTFRIKINGTTWVTRSHTESSGSYSYPREVTVSGTQVITTNYTNPTINVSGIQTSGTGHFDEAYVRIFRG
ncbi:phage tail protein [bacterium]|nr:phage tail protein [bacterium]